MHIVKVPYFRGSLGKNIGCEKAPDFLAENGELVLVNQNNVDETMKAIAEMKGDFFIGGDHSITYGSFNGFTRSYKNPGLIVFDAHPDAEVTSNSVTHEDFLRKLVEDGVLKKENIILIGIRAISKNEKEFIKGMHVFTMEQLFRNEEEVCDSLMEISQSFDAVYLSVDIDVLDPAFAPGTGYLEPGGLSVSELLYFLRRLRNLRHLKRVDLVEINPDKDLNGMTINIGKKILEVFE